jgi:hypothetical protein
MRQKDHFHMVKMIIQVKKFLPYMTRGTFGPSGSGSEGEGL